MKKIFIIEHIRGSKVPFTIKDAASKEDALEKVQKHMGSDQYRVAKVINVG